MKSMLHLNRYLNKRENYYILPAIVFFVASHAIADPGVCYTIKDADARSYCLAKAHVSSSYCYSINDSAKRSECLAEISRIKQ